MAELDIILVEIRSVRKDTLEQNQVLREEFQKGFSEFRKGCTICNTHLHTRITKQKDDLSKVKQKQNYWLGGIIVIWGVIQIFGKYIINELRF